MVTAPADFEVSLLSGAGFGSSVTLTQVGGTVTATDVFVRMLAATEGTPSGDIGHVSAGATTVNVAVSGSVVAPPPVPSIGVSGAPLVPFSSEPGVASDVQSYSVDGNDLTEGIVVTAPADFEVSLSSDAGFGASVTLSESGGTVAATDVFVRMLAASEGTPSGDISHVSAGATTVNVAVSGTVTTPPEPTEWVAYNDMNTLAGDPNPANVTSYAYDIAGSLKDYATGAVLPVTVTGSTSTPGGPAQVADGGPADTGTDAFAAFDGIVDLAGSDQLASGESSTLTFAGLDPNKTYAVTLSANQDDLTNADNRFAQVTIAGVDVAVAASSPGLITNSDGSVSFSVGDNGENGYVARWIAIDPGADGTFTVTSVWDESQGTVAAGTAPNTNGYAMAAFKLETFADDSSPSVSVASPVEGSTVSSPVSIGGSSSDDVGVVDIQLEIENLTTGEWWTGSFWQSARTSFAADVDDVGGLVSTWTYEFAPATTVSVPYEVTATAYDAAGNPSAAETVGFSVEAIPDETPPDGVVDIPDGGEVLAGPDVVVSGTATDDVGVGSVGVAIRDRGTGLWLQKDLVSFGTTYRRLLADLDAVGSTSTGWVFAVTLADGAYAIEVKVEDTSGNRDPSPPWVQFEVAS